MITKITPMRTVFALFLSVVAAYAFSFAIDLLLGGIFGIYPNTVYPPVVTWSVISAAAFIGAVKVVSLRGWLGIPFAVFGTLALFGALVGTHPHNFGIAVVVLLQATIIWFVSRRTPQNSHEKIIMITKIENYCLNQPVNEAPDLKEYTDEEYQMFEMAGYVKILKDEKIYHGKETNLNGSLWDTVIGATNGKIYKISLQIIDSDKKCLENIFKSTLNYIIKEMGKYNKHPFLSKRYIWNAQEGNFIYEQLSKFGQHCINIFITSGSIREQVQDYISKQ